MQGKATFTKKRTLPLTKNRKDLSRKILLTCAASIQQRIVSILLNKLKKAAIQTGVKDICIAGGVSANSGLRTAFQETGEKYHWNTFIPAFQYCTDNAAMIAITAYYKFLEKDFADLSVTASARASW